MRTPDGKAGPLGDETDVPTHRHAQSLTVTGQGCADANDVMDMIEDLPTGVYRVQGSILVADGTGSRSFGVQAVGPNVYVSGPESQEASWDSALVVFGESFDEEAVRAKLERALNAGEGCGGIERLRHHLRLHS